MIGTVKAPMRDRLVEAASDLFYAEGLRAVSVDKVIQRAGTTKVTFYRHFPSKDELVVAHLEKRAEAARTAITAAITGGGGNPARALELLSQTLGAVSCRPGFRGCAFINAAAEYPDPNSIVRTAVAEHRSWCAAAYVELVRPLDLPDPEGTATDLMLLRDGVMVAGYLDDPEVVAASFLRSGLAIIGAGRA